MADVLDIDNAEEFEVDDDGDRELLIFSQFDSDNEITIFRGNYEAEGEGKEKERPRIRS